jgi:5'-nucleotidase
MKVLLCNDDGVDAPGLWALYKAISEIADTLVVAPATERSAVGHGISVYNDVTLRRHIREEMAWGYGLDGTPADCVKMALSTIMKDDPPDLVISGINRGQNTGTSILYSGTVAAALEATMSGLPAIAISQALWVTEPDPDAPHRPAATHTSDMVKAMARNHADYSAAAKFASRLAQQVAKNGLPQGTLLNVNVPMLAEEDIRGVAISKMGRSIFVDQFHIVSECDGATCYRNIGDRLIQSPDGDDWDDLVLHQGKISITPLHYDMTHHDFLQQLREWALEEEQEAREASSEVASTIGAALRAEVHEN